MEARSKVSSLIPFVIGLLVGGLGWWLISYFTIQLPVPWDLGVPLLIIIGLSLAAWKVLSQPALALGLALGALLLTIFFFWLFTTIGAGLELIG